ncbi:MAG: glycosyltransferase family 4 protein [Halobacteria archaeon]
MKIAFLVWEYPPRIVGGLGTFAQNIAPEMVRQGHEVTIFTINPGDLKTEEVMEGVRVFRPLLVDASDVFPGVVAEDLRRWGKALKFFSDLFVYNLLSASAAVNLVRRGGERFDVICAHDWLSAMGGMILQKELKAPLVLHMHSTEWGRAMDSGSETVRNIEETAGRRADRVVTVSYPMEEDLVRHGWDASKIRVVWNGVWPDRYNPAAADPRKVEALRAHYGIGKGETLVLFVGRLTSVKGAVQLVQGFPEVLSAHPGARLVILGAGELDQTVAGLIRTLGLERQVKTCLRFVSEEERILHYAACDVAVLPSLYEPFGIVSLEAMAMGKPVVVGASGLSGFKDQVVPSGEEQTGVHVDGRNPSDIAWGIKALLHDMERAREMGGRGRQRVLKYFTWERAAKATLEVYQEAVAAAKR